LAVQSARGHCRRNGACAVIARRNPLRIPTMASSFAFLHFVGAFALFAALAAELVLARGTPDAAAMRRLARIDLVFGIAAIVVIAAGLMRVFYFEKGAGYYFHNAAFIAKLALFVVIGVLSAYPTRQFLAWRKELNKGGVPAVDADRMRGIRRVLHIEATLFVVLLLCASLMAHGVGTLGT
jgi:putative membrane protein